MEIEKIKAAIEAILFATGRVVKMTELMSALEISQENLIPIMESLREEYRNKGIEIIKVQDGYQMVTNSQFYEYIYPILDKRSKPNLSNAALETLSIIAYNPKITRAEIESIRGVNSDGTIYKLLDFNLIQEAGKLDAPGKPTTYCVTDEFFKLFGFSSLEELPELPRYKLDENQQIVIDDILEEQQKEAPEPVRVQEDELEKHTKNEGGEKIE